MKVNDARKGPKQIPLGEVPAGRVFSYCASAQIKLTGIYLYLKLNNGKGIVNFEGGGFFPAKQLNDTDLVVVHDVELTLK